MMDRRRFIKLSALSFCASQIFSSSRFLFSKKNPLFNKLGDFDASKNRRAAFDFYKENHRWLGGFTGTKEISFQKGSFHMGQAPQGMSGFFYRVGPGWLFDKKDRFAHWFEGEGLLQSIRIFNGGILHRAQMIKTPQMMVLQSKNERTHNTLATKKNSKQNSIYFPPNQSVLFLENKRLLALADGAFSSFAKPVEIDKNNLNLRGGVSKKNDITKRPLSSHVVVDLDKSIWNVVPDFPKKSIVLEQYTPQGLLYKRIFHPLSKIGYFHSFVVTQKKIVVIVPPLFFLDQKKDYLSSFFWSKKEPCQVLVFDKESFSFQYSVNTSAFFAMHFINGFEKDGKIIFDGLCYDDANILLKAYRDLMAGQWAKNNKEDSLYFPLLTRFTLDEKGVKKKVLSKNHYELPSIDHRDLGVEYNTVVLLKKKSRDKLKGGAPYYRHVTVRDMKLGWETSYRYPSFQIPEEHIYIPDKKKSNGQGGWVLGSVYDSNKDKTRIFIFNAEKMNEGPVAGVLLSYAMPIASHGKFVADF